MSELTSLTIAEARTKLRAKEIKATELTEAYISAIEAANDKLNAYVKVTPEKALQMAEASDGRLASGKGGALEGIPLGIKDLFATEGIHTQACSHILDGLKPHYESTVTQNLWDDGAVMLGKLNMDEFAMGSSNETSYYGAVINPWRSAGSNQQLVPGGSSGGSAAAVAAHLCAGATATDTGGSIRQPAAFTGTVGIKPTYGRCSRWGTVAFASSLDQAGPIARDVRDAAILLKSMASVDPKDTTTSGGIDHGIPFADGRPGLLPGSYSDLAQELRFVFAGIANMDQHYLRVSTKVNHRITPFSKPCVSCARRGRKILYRLQILTRCRLASIKAAC